MTIEGKGWWWLSFATDDECFGVCIVQGDNIIEATRKAHSLGINPGGEVLGIGIPEENYAEVFSMYQQNKLISTEELKAKGEKPIKDLPEDIREKILK